MTVLTACQSAMIRLVGQRPAAIFAASGQTEMEISDLINEVAIDIAKAHDWQALLTLETITGDGATIAHDLPADFVRMEQGADVHSGAWDGRYARVKDTNEWLDLQQFSAIANPGFWIILGGDMNILPAIPTGETAKFYYITNLIARDNGDTAKTAFTADTDTFVLPERLLTLGLIWQWRAMKRLPYSEEMETYGTALSQEIGNDRGARILRKGQARYPASVVQAYPGALGS